MLARNELAEHLLDTYGTCGRDKPERNDCYWGADALGRRNGCLFVGWRGRECPHWQSAGVTSLDELRERAQRSYCR